jgi:hypothetical protein
MRVLIRSAGLLLCCGFLVAGNAEAQFDQYTTPGGPEGRPVDRKAQLAKEVASARLRLGAVRVAPSFALKDAQYVKNLLGAAGSTVPNDFTATVSAGARAYLPTGPQVTWTAYALPEYVWWQRETGRRRFNGLYGLGLFGFWNRLTVAATAGSEAQQQVITPEVLRLASARSDQVKASVELRLSGAVSTFISGNLERRHSLAKLAEDPQALLLQQLDREERVARAGLRWRPPGGWMVGLGAERSDVDFSHRRGAIDRSNFGTAPVLELSRDRGRLFFQADVAQRSLSAKQGASFAHFAKTTGHAAISLEIAHGAEIFVYANRNLVYSLLPAYSYLDDLRHGAALHLRLGRRTAANVFGETGSEGYTALAPGTPRRRDDLTSFGGAISFGLVRSAALRLQGARTRFTSNQAGGSRSLTTLGLTVTLAGLP